MSAGAGVRLYAILARAAPSAVVFRRGPSKQVLLVSWRTDTDEFREGQWLKARVYERRCDLSPSGERLIYFAASHRPPYGTWTAVSRPPFFKALALWPKGDAWGGGGLFAGESEIHLNHRPGQMGLAEGFAPPKHVVVGPLGEHAGRGEDYPIEDIRLARDGWRVVQEGRQTEHGLKARVWIEVDPPQVRAKPNPSREGYELRQLTTGVHERQGPWYVTEHEVFCEGSGEKISLGRTDWADWCRSGDLLYAKGGKLFRLGFDRKGKKGRLLSPAEAKTLIDLSDRKFEPREAPPAASHWRGPV